MTVLRGSARPPEVRLVSMSEEDRQAFLERQAVDYAESKSKAGIWKPEESLEQSRAEIRRTVGETPEAGGHRFFHGVDASGHRVGATWYGPIPGREDIPGARWLFQIIVEEGLRGRGYGRAMLAAAEDLLRREGWSALHLNVFAFNEVAYSLYESSGYQAVQRDASSIEMRKRLVTP